MSVINFISSLNKFYEYLQSHDKRNLSMIIGLRITDPTDMRRNLKFDIAMDYYDSNELKTFFESELRELIPYFIFNMDLNCFCVLSKGIVAKYNNVNKLNKIVFDSSTFKFVSSVKLLALLYYLTLEQYGSIYIETNSPMCTGYLILNQQELLNIIAKNAKDGFHYQTGYILPKSTELSLKGESLELINCHITTREQIYLQNVEFFTKWFYGSSVELLDNVTDSYPITNVKYPVTKYYKITKELPHDEILNFASRNAKEYDAGLNLKSRTILRM